jgi:hypothetical protein
MATAAWTDPMTDDVAALLRLMQTELEARFEILMQEVSKLQQRLLFLEADIIDQKIAGQRRRRRSAPNDDDFHRRAKSFDLFCCILPTHRGVTRSDFHRTRYVRQHGQLVVCGHADSMDAAKAAAELALEEMRAELQ